MSRRKKGLRELGEAQAFPRFGPGIASAPGLTKREWMATQILAGALASERAAGTPSLILAQRAVLAADTLIEALQYPEDPPRE